jgi:hypothetical protein
MLNQLNVDVSSSFTLVMKERNEFRENVNLFLIGTEPVNLLNLGTLISQGLL